MKIWLIGKDRDVGKDWRQEEKGITEDEMVGWHHWLDGPEFKQAPGVGDIQGSLVCCSPQGRKESDMTEQWTELKAFCNSFLYVQFDNFHALSSSLLLFISTLHIWLIFLICYVNIWQIWEWENNFVPAFLGKIEIYEGFL